jgi:hypothetical protein
LNETAWVYSKRMPPLSAMKRWPASELRDQHRAGLAAGPIDAVLLHGLDFRAGQ